MENKLDNIGQHISQKYDAELDIVRNLAMQMGGEVEAQLANAVKALIENNVELAEKVVISDYKVNRLEVDIDERCTQIIARRQPTASDLRLIISIIKSVTDLERIGDEAEKIARFAIKSNEINNNNLNTALRHLAKHVREMLRNTLDAMARMDAPKAMEVARSDSLIDSEFEYLSRGLLTHMIEDPRNIKDSMNVTWCARSLERIGDHCKNICEYVVYLVEGKDVRHTTLDKASAMAQLKS